MDYLPRHLRFNQFTNQSFDALCVEQSIMLRFDGFLKDPCADVFNPKVTPDPSASERLEAKLLEAAQHLRHSFSKNYAQRILGLQRQTSG
jgi:hypothetical protein